MSSADDRPILGAQSEGGRLAPRRSHRGRWTSWAAVVVMIAGFTAAGLGLTLGPSWALVAGGTAVFLAGGAGALALGILRDVVLDEPRAEREEPHGTPWPRHQHANPARTRPQPPR
ncbi:hypothetical protein [Marinactinospora rubrisoli]|uniref:Uncharacterized protein n=1 Tax=Marinactinospora rubrisoli TaxID=2715399 RepID=A0ABW2KB80_9ACTN